jgi:hypothetical protein
MSLDAPGNEGDALRDEQRAGTVLHYFAGALERGERGVECAPLARPDGEARGELVGFERRAGAIQRLENLAAVVIGSFSPIPSAKRCSFGFFL